MNYILLVGAGFSCNWGGWTSAELVGDLLGRVANDRYLSEQLSKSGNFEDVLELVRSRKHDKVVPFERAIQASFNEMNSAFLQLHTIEFSNQREYSITDFLGRFDAIFSLNQDQLFELKYDPGTTHQSGWSGAGYPGVARQTRHAPFDHEGQLNSIWDVTDRHEIDDVVQPIFHLHGSTNWRDSSNGTIMVLGGAKEEAVNRHPILRWYFEEFEQRLAAPNTRLMICGCGFRDQHVNNVIARAASKGLQLYYVDPKGRDVTDPNSPKATIRVANPFEKIQCIGESRRPLATTFAGDRLEYRKLMRFFDS